MFQYLGQSYSGSYEVWNGIIAVSSAYGSKSAEIGTTRANVVAAALMEQIVHEFRR